MKRLISAVLVLLALGAAAFFFWKLRRYLPERPRAAELAPPETIFFAQFPNLRQTALRVPQSDLYKIWSEPDVQAFLEKPRRKAPRLRAWTERFDDVLRAAPGEAFVAIASVENGRVAFVAGFSFAGSQQSAQTLATHLREQLLPGGSMVSTFRANWCLCASDAARLDALLARFDGKPGPALATTPAFQQATAPFGLGQDLVLYGKPSALSGRLDVLAGLGGPAKPTADEPMAMATKIDGAKLHDTIFLPGNNIAPPAVRPRPTLSLASAQTLLYYATDVALLRPSGDFGFAQTLVPGFAEMEKRLAEKGLAGDDLPAAFGPELGIMAEWPEDAALPTLLLAAEIRDAAKARSFFDLLTRPPAPSAAWQAEPHDGIAVLTAPTQGLSLIRPAAALTERFALLGTSPEAIAGALPKAGSQKPTLAQAASFQEVARFIPEQSSAFGYLDFPRLFDRVYRVARPFISLSLAFSANAGAQFDAGKLPPADAISKHLSATVFSQSPIAGGTVIESTGSVTIPELLLSVGAGGAATGLPDLSGMLPGGLNRALTKRSRVPSGASKSAPTATPPEKDAPIHK